MDLVRCDRDGSDIWGGIRGQFGGGKEKSLTANGAKNNLYNSPVYTFPS